MVGVLTECKDYNAARNYWKVTKHRMIAEGNELVTNCNRLKLMAERLVLSYERLGYSKEWINQRLQAISARKELTDEWKERGINSFDDEEDACECLLNELKRYVRIVR